MDGDMVDPAQAGITDDELADPDESGPHSHAHGDLDANDLDPDSAALYDDFARASEVDDITDSMARPDGRVAVDGVVEDGVADDLVDVTDVDVHALLAEREEFKHLAQRVQADFDNFRRRSQGQAQADADRATGRLAEALLPVLDAAEAAFLRHPDEVGPLLNQMLSELKKHGLEMVDLDGQPFDPEVAEAVAHEPGAGGAPVVAEVLRSGYLWKGRVLRAAMVRTKD